MSAPAPAVPPGPDECPDWAQQWALFLDIDGTLLDFADKPQGVRVPDGLTARIARVAGAVGGALALVSGRPLDGIDRLFPGTLDAAGTHGAQWRLAGAERDVGPAVAEQLSRTGEQLSDRLRGWPGVLLERKPHAIALHYRLAPDRAAEVQALAGRTVLALGSDFRLQRGKEVVEILPAAAGKGAAIRRFMGTDPYAGRTPVFVGDDLTDEDGFEAVNALGGFAIRVGDEEPSAAGYRLRSPGAVRDWLKALAATLE